MKEKGKVIEKERKGRKQHFPPYARYMKDGGGKIYSNYQYDVGGDKVRVNIRLI